MAASSDGATLGRVPVKAHTYGAPRVGNFYFAQQYSSVANTTWRIVHGADVVPHLPLLSSAYYHVATEVWERDDAKDVVCDSTGEDPNCSNSNAAYNTDDHLVYLGVRLVNEADACPH